LNKLLPARSANGLKAYQYHALPSDAQTPKHATSIDQNTPIFTSAAVLHNGLCPPEKAVIIIAVVWVFGKDFLEHFLFEQLNPQRSWGLTDEESPKGELIFIVDSASSAE